MTYTDSKMFVSDCNKVDLKENDVSKKNLLRIKKVV